MPTLITRSSDETQAFGRFLGGRLAAGDVVGLSAPLGAGKTWLSKGVVEGFLGLHADAVTSPAFTLVNEYSRPDRPCIVYHMDFYRMEDLEGEDFEMLREYFLDRNAIVLAEWGDKFLPVLADDYLSISLSYCSDGDDLRLLESEAIGTNIRYSELAAEIAEYAHAHS